MSKEQTLAAIVRENRNRTIGVNKVISNSPKTIPLISKLVSDNKTPPAKETEEDKLAINKGILLQIHSKMAAKRTNNISIQKLFPDIELAIQILISSIFSPKKMTDIQLNYKFDKKLKLSPEPSSKILEFIKTYVNDNYELEERLPEILRDILANSGSCPVAVIPEAALDQIINRDLLASYSNESFKTAADKLVNNLVSPMNINTEMFKKTSLPDKSKLSLESLIDYLSSGSLVNFTDNPKFLHFNEVRESVISDVVRKSARTGNKIAMESHEKIKYLDIFREQRGFATGNEVTFVRNKSETLRKSMGKSMLTFFPSEAVVPVCLPGNESKHAGYLVLFDEDGKPLSGDSKEAAGMAINNFYQIKTPNAQNPISTAYNSLLGDAEMKVDSNQLFTMYKDIMEQKLYSTINSSLSGKSVKISDQNDLYFLMFTRALSNQKTNVLFLPKELMTYFAFYYDEYGVGKSLLDNLSILCSLRAILLFARVMAQTKQAINVTKVGVDLDPRDQDPEKTIAQIQDAVLRMRQNYFPLGINNPADLINWIQRAGLQFEYRNNSLLPDVKIDFTNGDYQNEVPDSELEDELKKQTIQAMGLDPEVVDAAFGPDFATSVVNNNVLFAKRIMVYQKKLATHTSNLISQFVYMDEDLRTELKRLFEENEELIVGSLPEDEKAKYKTNKETFLDEFLDTIGDSIHTEFPKPENSNLVNMSMEFKLYKDSLLELIPAVISDELFPEGIAGELAPHIGTLQQIYMNYLLRKWCSDNNYFPELLELTSDGDEEIESITKIIVGHLTGTMQNATALLTAMQKFKEAVNVDLSKVSGEGASSVSSSDSSSSSSSDGGSGGGIDGDLGGEDLLNF